MNTCLICPGCEAVGLELEVEVEVLVAELTAAGVLAL
jgi:hypothetical protein